MWSRHAVVAQAPDAGQGRIGCSDRQLERLEGRVLVDQGEQLRLARQAVDRVPTRRRRSGPIGRIRASEPTPLNGRSSPPFGSIAEQFHIPEPSGLRDAVDVAELDLGPDDRPPLIVDDPAPERAGGPNARSAMIDSPAKTTRPGSCP